MLVPIAVFAAGDQTGRSPRNDTVDGARLSFGYIRSASFAEQARGR
jgi:hypothetical protein